MLKTDTVRRSETSSYKPLRQEVSLSQIKGDFRDSQSWDPFMVSFPYHSHIFRDSYGSGMGNSIMGKGSHLLGVPDPTDQKQKHLQKLPAETCFLVPLL